MQCLSQQGPPEIATLHREALFLNKGNREIGHADQLDGKAVGWGTTIALLSISRKKEVHKFVILGEDGAFKEEQNQTELNKEGEQHLWIREENRTEILIDLGNKVWIQFK